MTHVRFLKSLGGASEHLHPSGAVGPPVFILGGGRREGPRARGRCAHGNAAGLIGPDVCSGGAPQACGRRSDVILNPA